MDAAQIHTLIGPGFSAEAISSHAPAGTWYTDPELAAAEQQRIFGREWNYVCHHSELAEPGAYRVVTVAGQSLYVIRGRDGELRAFHNVCQHRGHELLTGQGVVGNVVVCPYHSWSYGHEGDLRGAPKMRQVPDFCKEDVALASIRIEVIGGFIFVNLDPNAEPLREGAPDFEPILQSMAAEAEDLQLVGVHTFDIAANWKIVTENFLEAYHVEFSGQAHQALGNVIDVDTYRFAISGRTIEYTAKGGLPDVLPYASNPTDAFTNSRGAPFHQVFLWPNMTFSVFPGTNLMFVYVMSPKGTDRTAEQILWFGLDADVTKASREAEDYVSRALNHEDISLVEAVQRGVRSPGYRPGRLMVDADQSEGWSEQFVHHFTSLTLEALTRST